jgi:hypothetical protein
MSIIKFAESVMNVKLSYHQKELLVLLSNNDKEYLHSVVSNKPTQAIKAVVEVYGRYCDESLVSV